MKAVLAGCGGISAAWLTPLRERTDVALVGLVDLNEEAARKRAAEFGLADAVTGTDLPVVLKQTAADIVFDCTLPEAHVDVTLTALAHGCHVLGEKPLADTMDNARKMVAAAAEAGKIYAVMQNRRYQPNIRNLRRFLESGALGRLTTVHCDFMIGAHFGGFRDRMRHVLLLDMAIHTFDAARFICGCDPVRVMAHEWNPPGSWYDHDASAIAAFEMSDEVVYSYRGSWCAEGQNTSWEADWRIIGEKGTVVWNGGDEFACEVVRKAEGFRSETDTVPVPTDGFAGMAEGHAGCIDEFMRCVASGAAPLTVCTDNINSLAMVHAAIASAEQACRVDVQAV